MTKFRKRLLIGLIVFFLLLLSGGIYLFSKSNGVEYVMTQTVRGELARTVDASGELQAFDRAELSFATSGIIAEKNVKVGQKIKAGEELMVLEADEVLADIARANQQVAIAEARLNLDLAGARLETVAIQEAGIASAESLLRIAEVDLANTILLSSSTVAEAEIVLQNAERDLANVEEQNVIRLREAKENYVSTLKASVIEIRNAIAKADEVLGIENQLINVDFKDILAITDSGSLNRANTQFTRATDSRSLAESALLNLPSNPTDAELTQASQIIAFGLSETATLLLYTRQVLDATTVDTATFSFAELIALKAKIDGARDAIQLDESQLLSAKQSYLSSSITVKTQTDSAQKAVDLASISLTKALANEKASVRMAEAQVENRKAEVQRAKATLAELQADPRMVELAGLRAEVNRSKADLLAAQARLKRYQIISPLDGIVTAVKAEIGEQALAGSPLITVEGTNASQLHIALLVSESDIARVNIGDEAIVTLDAYGDAYKIPAEVGEIYPSATLKEGIVYYEVKIFLGAMSDALTLRTGMSADVIIISDKLNDAISVERRAVFARPDGTHYVRIRSGKAVVEKTVTTGLIADEGRIQILTGLTEGEEVILTIRE